MFVELFSVFVLLPVVRSFVFWHFEEFQVLSVIVPFSRHSFLFQFGSAGVVRPTASRISRVFRIGRIFDLLLIRVVYIYRYVLLL